MAYLSGAEYYKPGRYVFYGVSDAGNNTGYFTITIDRTVKTVDISNVTDGKTNGDPDKSLVYNSIQMMQDILNHAKDNIALIDRVLQKKDDLLDNHDDMQRVESFFSNQVTLFDAAVKLEADLRNDLSYMAQDEEGNKALNQIRLIVMIDVNRTFDYKKIPLLNELMEKVKDAHDVLLVAKRKELLEIVQGASNGQHICRFSVE